MDHGYPPLLWPHRQFPRDHLSTAPELPSSHLCSGNGPALAHSALPGGCSKPDAPMGYGPWHRRTGHSSCSRFIGWKHRRAQTARDRALLSLQSKALCPQAARKSGGAACSRHCLALPRELQGQNMSKQRQSGCHLSRDRAGREKDAMERLCQQSSFFAESKHNSRRSPMFKGTESDLLLRKQQNCFLGLKTERYSNEIIF